MVRKSFIENAKSLIAFRSFKSRKYPAIYFFRDMLPRVLSIIFAYIFNTLQFPFSVFLKQGGTGLHKKLNSRVFIFSFLKIRKLSQIAL